MSPPSGTHHILHVAPDPEPVAAALERDDDRVVVSTATTADDGLERLAETDVDCIVSAYALPHRDGLAFLTSVREEHPDLPFILFTDAGDEAVASEAISAGVTDYLRHESGDEGLSALARRVEAAVEEWRDVQQSERTRALLEALMTNSTDTIIAIDTESTIRFANPAVEESFGYDPESLVGEPLTTLMPARYHDDHLAAVDRYLATGERTLDWSATELPVRHERGHELTASISFSEFEWNGERRFVGVLRDITDRKRSEQRLRKQQAFNEIALDSVLEFYWVLDTEGYVTDWSDADGSVTGYRPQEAIGMHATEFFPEDEQAYIGEKIQELQETGTVTAEGEFRTKDGTCVPYRFDGTVLTDDEGQVERLCGFGQDISEQVEQERRLREERDFVEQLTQMLPDIFYLIGHDGTLRRWNDRFSAVTGRPDDEIDAMQVIEFFAEADRPRVRDAIDEALTTGQAVVEADLVTADGSHIPYEFTAGRLHGEDIDMDGLVGIGRDISERKAYEEKLEHQNQRLDRFASVISHDLRNPLNVAEGRLELARKECDSDHLEDVVHAHERMDALIEDLLALAREGTAVTDPEPVALETILDQCWDTVETANASLVVDVDRTIQADDGRLKQLFENLIRNSVEHGGADVTVTVGTLDDGFYVADDGPGIPESERTDVFEAGYSTSERGTGFGLSIVEQIAEAHGWSVRVVESDAGGARFEIRDVAFV